MFLAGTTVTPLFHFLRPFCTYCYLSIDVHLYLDFSQGNVSLLRHQYELDPLAPPNSSRAIFQPPTHLVPTEEGLWNSIGCLPYSILWFFFKHHRSASSVYSHLFARWLIAADCLLILQAGKQQFSTCGSLSLWRTNNTFMGITKDHPAYHIYIVTHDGRKLAVDK